MNINLTIFGQAISFAIFVWFCMRFVWPPILVALQQRQDTVDAAHNAARQAQEKQELLLNEMQAERIAFQRQMEVQQHENKQMVAKMFEDARKEASELREKLMKEAKAEIALQLAKVENEMATLVRNHASDIASKLIGKALHADGEIDMSVIQKDVRTLRHTLHI